MSIGKYCNRDVVTAPPGICIYAAARMMSMTFAPRTYRAAMVNATG
ncbi:hypothetical protein [Pseudomonas sp. BBP2017]|nr:hypothetical protein [Pseudomonas sp. BBP2017]